MVTPDSLSYAPAESVNEVASSAWQHSQVLGRQADLLQMHTWLKGVLAGERRTVFVTGEPGMGKATSSTHFLKGPPTPLYPTPHDDITTLLATTRPLPYSIDFHDYST